MGRFQEIGFEWSIAGISIGTYVILNDLYDDVTSKVLKFADDTSV